MTDPEPARSPWRPQTGPAPVTASVPPRSRAAALGVVLAVVLPPAGVAVSALAIRRTHGGARGGRDLAIAGLVVGIVACVLWGLLALGALTLYGVWLDLLGAAQGEAAGKIVVLGRPG